MTGYGDLLAATKQQIVEVDTATAAQLIKDNHITLDVREPEEFDQGALSTAIHIPRGHLESQIEQRLPERDTKIVVYCAGGARSALDRKSVV